MKTALTIVCLLALLVCLASGASAHLTGIKIAVDPGHGGSDPGAVANGINEKDINLDIGLRMRDIMQLDAATIFMTRTTDVYITLQGRCDIANNNGANRFECTHCNAFNGVANGTETYCSPTGTAEAFDLRNKVQTELVAHMQTTDRGGKTNTFYVLENTTMPAILGEVAFLDNPADQAKLTNPTYRQEAARAYLHGTQSHYGVAPHDPVADTEPPTVPTNLTATPVSSTQINLAWSASTDNVGVTGYKVYRDSVQIGTSATTTYSDSTCSPSTTYTYTVSAYDAATNESAQSAPAVATTPGVTSKNYAPTAITLTRGTVTSGTVANLAANDSSYLVISAKKVGSTRYVDWYSSVSIAEAPASITKLTITFDGKLSASLTQTLHIYNFSTSSWTQIDSRTVGTSDVTVSWNTTSPASYISATGGIRLRQYVTSSSSFTSSSDFAQFTVEF